MAFLFNLFTEPSPRNEIMHAYGLDRVEYEYQAIDHIGRGRQQHLQQAIQSSGQGFAAQQGNFWQQGYGRGHQANNYSQERFPAQEPARSYTRPLDPSRIIRANHAVKPDPFPQPAYHRPITKTSRPSTDRTSSTRSGPYSPIYSTSSSSSRPPSPDFQRQQMERELHSCKSQFDRLSDRQNQILHVRNNPHINGEFDSIRKELLRLSDQIYRLESQLGKSAAYSNSWWNEFLILG